MVKLLYSAARLGSLFTLSLIILALTRHIISDNFVLQSRNDAILHSVYVALTSPLVWLPIEQMRLQSIFTSIHGSG